MDDQSALAQLRPRPSSVDYFNLDDILATQEKVPSRFELPVYRLGFLDPSTNDEHLSKGTKLDLPYWLARDLCTRRRKIVSVEIPKVYGENYRQIFKADANVLDLHKMGPYFYKFGVKLLHFEHVDAGVIARSLLQGHHLLHHLYSSQESDLATPSKQLLPTTLWFYVSDSS